MEILMKSIIVKVVVLSLLFSCNSNQDEKKETSGEKISTNTLNNQKIPNYSAPGVTDCYLELNLGKPEQGCEGEACLCVITRTEKPKAINDTFIYSKPDLNSPQVSQVKAGETVLKAVPYLIRRQPGVGEILEDDYEENGKLVPKPTGVKVFILNYEGENYYSYCRGANKDSTDMIKIISEAKIEHWLEVETTDGKKGWVEGHFSFQFLESCG